MIDLHYWPTPNGHKITMFLEETGAAYTIHPVNIGAGEQFKPDFLRIAPNNRMPAIVDNAPADGGAPIPYAIERYANETNRLYGVLNRRLADRAHVAGDDYTIADIACYPWIVPHERQRQDLNDFPHLKRWFESIAARPATQRAYALGPKYRKQATMSAEEKKILFGQTAAVVK